MIDWRRLFRRETRGLIAFLPLLVLSALIGWQACGLRVPFGLGQAPVPPFSPLPTPPPLPPPTPLPTPTPVSGDIALNLQSNPWFLGAAALMVIAIIVVFMFANRRE